MLHFSYQKPNSLTKYGWHCPMDSVGPMSDIHLIANHLNLYRCYLIATLIPGTSESVLMLLYVRGEENTEGILWRYTIIHYL